MCRALRLERYDGVDHEVDRFGRDVAFWLRPPTPEYAAVLDEFLRLDVPHERWDDPSFEPVLQRFARRFRATGTEEGAVMETVLAYAMQDAFTSGRRDILVEFRESAEITELLHRGVRELGGDRLALSLQAD